MDEVRDIRIAGWHWAHNDTLDRFGPVVGPIPMAVYYVLCRFSDKDGQCHPSHAAIAKKLGMSKRGVINALSRLEEAGLVRVQRRRDTAGDKDSNLYFLLGGSECDALPSEQCALPSAPDAPGVVNDVHQGSAPRAHKQEPLNKNQKNKTSSPDGDSTSTTIYPPDFEAFWKAYPNKKAKGYALKAWVQIKGRPSPEALIASVERAKGSRDWRKDNGAFIPHPATWLRGRCWEDEPEPDAPKAEARAVRYCLDDPAGEYHSLFTLMFERGQTREMLRSIGKLLSLSATLTPQEQAILAEYEPQYPQEFAAYRAAAVRRGQ